MCIPEIIRKMVKDGLLLLTPRAKEKYTTTLLHQSGRYLRIYYMTLPKLLSVIYRQLPKRYKKVMEWTTRQWRSLAAAANLERVQAHVKKAKREIEKFDNEKVNPFKVIASFPAIKARIDGNLPTDSNATTINELVGIYQLDNDDIYCFNKERQYAYFQSPFQAEQWANADVLFSDIDYTGCHHFPYLLNIACLNSYTTKYMACGRALLNRQDAISIGKALSILVYNVATQHHGYDVTKAHKEILIDFDDAEANAFVESFG